jgi:hypothetical protein
MPIDDRLSHSLDRRVDCPQDVGEAHHVLATPDALMVMCQSKVKAYKPSRAAAASRQAIRGAVQYCCEDTRLAESTRARRSGLPRLVAGSRAWPPSGQ